jgi:hypothetical protein
LLFDLSARIMITPFDQVDSEIDNALRQIKVFFQVDPHALPEVQEDKTFVSVSHAVYGDAGGDKSRRAVSVELQEIDPWGAYQHQPGGRLS